MLLMRLGAILFLTGIPLAAQGVTELVPQSVTGSRISADGRYVLHQEEWPSLLLRVFDTGTGQTTHLGVASDSHAELSGNGQFVAYKTDLGLQCYVLDRNTGIVEVVSKSSSGAVGNDTSYDPSLSDDGRYVSFRSYASNLVVGDTNGASDVFVHDRLSQITTRVSVNGGYQAVSGSGETRISGNGEWVYFLTGDLLLAGGRLVLHHLPTGLTTCPVAGTSFTDPDRDPRISRYGQHVAYGDTFGRAYRRDLWNGITTPISVLPNGTHVTGSSDGELSPDGGFFLFKKMINLPSGPVMRQFLRDIDAGVTHVVNVDSAGIIGDDICWTPTNGGPPACNGYFGDVSDFGRHVTFTSWNPSLAPGDGSTYPNVFLRHLTPHLGAPPTVTMGTTAALALSAPEHAGKAYVVGLSTSYFPGIPVDWRWAPLGFDDLLAYSLTPGAPFFVGFTGTLDGSGAGGASIQIPIATGLSGASFYAAFAVLDAAAPSGIAAFSNAAPITIL